MADKAQKTKIPMWKSKKPLDSPCSPKPAEPHTFFTNKATTGGNIPDSPLTLKDYAKRNLSLIPSPVNMYGKTNRRRGDEGPIKKSVLVNIIPVSPKIRSYRETYSKTVKQAGAEKVPQGIIYSKNHEAVVMSPRKEKVNTSIQPTLLEAAVVMSPRKEKVNIIQPTLLEAAVVMSPRKEKVNTIQPTLLEAAVIMSPEKEKVNIIQPTLLEAAVVMSPEKEKVIIPPTLLGAAVISPKNEKVNIQPTLFEAAVKSPRKEKVNIQPSLLEEAVMSPKKEKVNIQPTQLEAVVMSPKKEKVNIQPSLLEAAVISPIKENVNIQPSLIEDNKEETKTPKNMVIELQVEIDMKERLLNFRNQERVVKSSKWEQENFLSLLPNDEEKTSPKSEVVVEPKVEHVLKDPESSIDLVAWAIMDKINENGEDLIAEDLESFHVDSDVHEIKTKKSTTKQENVSCPIFIEKQIEFSDPVPIFFDDNSEDDIVDKEEYEAMEREIIRAFEMKNSQEEVTKTIKQKESVSVKRATQMNNSPQEAKKSKNSRPTVNPRKYEKHENVTFMKTDTYNSLQDEPIGINDIERPVELDCVISDPIIVPIKEKMTKETARKLRLNNIQDRIAKGNEILDRVEGGLGLMKGALLAVFLLSVIAGITFIAWNIFETHCDMKPPNLERSLKESIVDWIYNFIYPKDVKSDNANQKSIESWFWRIFS